MKNIYLNDIPVDLFLEYFSGQTSSEGQLEPSMEDFKVIPVLYNIIINENAKLLNVKVYRENYITTDFLEKMFINNNDLKDYKRVITAISENGKFSINLYNIGTLIKTILINYDDENYKFIDIKELGNSYLTYKIEHLDTNNFKLTLIIDDNSFLFGKDANDSNINIYKVNFSKVNIIGTTAEPLYLLDSGTYSFYPLDNDIPVQIQKIDKNGNLLYKNQFGVDTTREYSGSGFFKHRNAIRSSMLELADAKNKFIEKMSSRELAILFTQGANKISYYDEILKIINYSEATTEDLVGITVNNLERIPKNTEIRSTTREMVNVLNLDALPTIEIFEYDKGYQTIENIEDDTVYKMRAVKRTTKIRGLDTDIEVNGENKIYKHLMYPNILFKLFNLKTSAPFILVPLIGKNSTSTVVGFNIRTVKNDCIEVGQYKHYVVNRKTAMLLIGAVDKDDFSKKTGFIDEELTTDKYIKIDCEAITSTPIEELMIGTLKYNEVGNYYSIDSVKLKPNFKDSNTIEEVRYVRDVLSPEKVYRITTTIQRILNVKDYRTYNTDGTYTTNYPSNIKSIEGNINDNNYIYTYNNYKYYSTFLNSFQNAKLGDKDYLMLFSDGYFNVRGNAVPEGIFEKRKIDALKSLIKNIFNAPNGSTTSLKTLSLGKYPYDLMYAYTCGISNLLENDSSLLYSKSYDATQYIKSSDICENIYLTEKTDLKNDTLKFKEYTDDNTVSINDYLRNMSPDPYGKLINYKKYPTDEAYNRKAISNAKAMRLLNENVNSIKSEIKSSEYYYDKDGNIIFGKNPYYDNKTNSFLDWKDSVISLALIYATKKETDSTGDSTLTYINNLLEKNKTDTNIEIINNTNKEIKCYSSLSDNDITELIKELNNKENKDKWVILNVNN